MKCVAHYIWRSHIYLYTTWQTKSIHIISVNPSVSIKTSLHQNTLMKQNQLNNYKVEI